MSGTVTEGKGSRLAAAGGSDWKHAIVDMSCQSEDLMVGLAAATDCITTYRCSLLTMSLAAAAVLIVSLEVLQLNTHC